jgi:hypothetical protein
MDHYRASSQGTRYQVAVAVVSPPPPDADLLATFFDPLLDGFAASAGLRRDGPTERLMVAGRPAAQARFADAELRSVARVVHLGDRVVMLAVLTAGPVDEDQPEIGRFLNSLRVAR